MVISADIERKHVFFSSANVISGFFNRQITGLVSYLTLSTENEYLADENIRLRKELAIANQKLENTKTTYSDSIEGYQFQFIPARVVKNSISLGKNFITIDKGEKHGIEKDFGVIGTNGVVGIVVATSNRFSLVVSVLNTGLGISGKIKKNNYFGSVQWEGSDYRYINMYEIPNHLEIEIGDTVVTSGFSAVFPAGIDIGTIAKIEKNVSNNFFDLELELFVDFKNLDHVYVINNKLRREQVLLEKTIEDEY
jgi:rod shape-determining protein MreC